ncbi:sigma-70 family RNA polymerase sigma factor [Candidatus Poribacteria bacterium]|nr:sigma-70 family RNA polymerase sigma factor [Candidatus Poribacteria bacterium]
MQQTDTELIQRVLTGDDDAFALLVSKYQKQVHALAWRLVKDFHIAEEVTQDAFLNAYKELKNLKEQQNFAGWLSVITRRQCYARLRKKRLWTQSLEYLEQTDIEQIEEVVFSEYVVEERERTAIQAQREVVQKLLTKLQESERTVITLHYFGEMSCSEIGEFLGVSANTIKSRLRRAHHRLKKNEPLIKEALENFKITPNLTENIMREITKTDPIAPSTSKPFAPWFAAASTLVFVLIMLGIGNNRSLLRFQKPYNLDAVSDVTVEIVETPVLEDRILEPDRRRLIGNSQVQRENPVSKQQPDETQLQSTEAGKENSMESYPQWNLPERAKARLGKGGTWSIQFSPDGTQLALSCPTGVWFYDVKTGKELSLIPGQRGSLAFSPDGRFLAKGGDQFQLWEIATQREIPLPDDFSNTNVLRFSNDSRTLVCLGKEGDKIYRYDIEIGKHTEIKLQKESTGLHLIDCALAEGKIAIGNRDGKLELWDTHTGEKLSTLRERGKKIKMPDYFTHTYGAITLEFSLDGKLIAAGNLDTTIKIWDTTSGEELSVLQKTVEGSNMWSVSSIDGKEIVNNPMKNEGYDRPSALAFSPDTSLIACGSEDSTVKLWNTITDELIATFTGHLSNVRHLAFSPDGNILASGSSDGTVRFWDIETKQALQTRIIGHMWIRTASFLGDGSNIASVFSNGIITNWDLKNSEKTTLITKATLEEPLYWMVYRHLVLSPDATKLAIYGIQSNPSEPNYLENILRLTDVNTGQEVATFPRIVADVFSPDGKTAACSGGNTIRLLNMETGETRNIITSDHDEDSDEHKPLIASLVFSPDGKNIVSGTMGGHLQIWRVETGEKLSAFFEETPPKGSMYQEAIRSLAYSSDGALLAVGSTEHLRLIGSAKQRDLKEVVYGPGEYNDTFIFSPDDTMLIVGIGDGRIELWDVVTGEKLTSLDGHTAFARDLKFSPDNKTLMSVGGGNILLWDWDTVLKSARGKDTDNTSEQILPTAAEPTENVLQFVENSSQKLKISDHVLWKGEIYLANEWFDVALEEFTKYLSAADWGFLREREAGTHPSFHRTLFVRIGKAAKDIQDKDGFANMMDEIITYFTDSLSIQLHAHLVLAQFYHDNDMLEKADEHIQLIDSLTADLSTARLSLQSNAYLSLADYYHNSGILDKAEMYIQKIHDMDAELDLNELPQLRFQLDTRFSLAEYYRDKGMDEMADEHIKKTGFVTEDAWMVLGPFDNADGIGYDTAYIPEDITEIDLSVKYDGVDGPIRWKKFTDAELDGYIHLGEQHVDWQVSYAFATINAPDEWDVQFRFDSDDQGKVWINGKEVFSHTKAFMAIVDTYTIPVKLKPGKNSILVKVCNEMGGWGFFLRITSEDGQPFDDLIINSAIQNTE